MKKQCAACGQTKLVSEFYRNGGNVAGYRTKCKRCYLAATSTHAKTTTGRENNRRKQAAWRSKNLEKARARSVANQRRYTKQLRDAALAKLGTKCRCGVDDIRVLHVHDSDCTLRAKLTRWRAAASDTGNRFFLLCANCNHRERLARQKEPKDIEARHQRDYANRLRQKALKKLGELRCQECGEADPDVLCVDHCKGEGRKHRAEVGGSNAMYRLILRSKNCQDFQVLCHNCNWIKRHRRKEYGGCVTCED